MFKTNSSNKLSYSYLIVLLLPVVLLIPLLFNANINLYVFLLVIMAGVLISLNYKAIPILLILSITVYFKIMYIQVSVWLTYLLLISFLVTHKNIRLKELKNSLTFSLLIFVLCILPSLVNSYNKLLSIYYMQNLLAIILVYFAISLSLRNFNQINTLLYVYIFGILLSSFSVIYLGFLTGQRVFGYSEVLYIDLAGVALILSLIFFLYEDGIKKIIFGLFSLIISFGLILTQTRNAWLSTLLSILILGVFLLVKNEKVLIKKRKVIVYFASITFSFIFLFLVAKVFSPGVEERVSAAVQERVVNDNPVSIVGDSFLTRLLIWHTAILAFLKHPFLGIGIYSFPFSSKLYTVVPESFYNMYVKGLNPHHGYLGVLTETGILGFMGLIFFLKSTFKIVLINLKLSKKKQEVIISLFLLGATIYISISLFFTQEWLYGQMAVLFGLILGLISTSYRLLMSKDR